MDLPLAAPGRRLADAPRAARASLTAAEPSAPAASAATGLAAGTLTDAPPSAPAATRPMLASRPDRSRPVGVPRAPGTAFVLAGGTSLGALQAGMLRGLYEGGITPDVLVGTSAGALNAAYVASRPRTVQTAKELARAWRGLRREDVFPIHPRTLIAGLSNHRDHLVPGGPLGELISRHLEFERLEQADVPLHPVAFDLLAGKEVRLSEGPALAAVLAAAAIPGGLPPVRWGERLLVGAGLSTTRRSRTRSNSAPGASTYCPPRTHRGGRSPSPRAARWMPPVHALTVLADARLESDLARYGSEAEMIVLPAANPGHVQPTDFDQADRLIGAALQAARAVLSRVAVQSGAAS